MENETVEYVIGDYYYLENGLSQALTCTDNPDCPRHGKNTDEDRERIAQIYLETMTDLCHRLVRAVENEYV